MHAITINITAIERFKLTTINKVKSFIESYDDTIKVYVIAAERTPENNNIHYHVMSSDISDGISKLMWASKIWNDPIKNELMYYEYIIKDGNYKIFNDYMVPNYDRTKDQYQALLNDIYVHNKSLDEIRVKYPKLYVRHYRTIMNMLIESEGKL